VKSILLIFCFFSNFVVGQILDNSRGEAFTDQPFFNQEFIVKNKIKSFQGEFSYKKSGDIMRQTDYISAYTFDEKGRLLTQFETRIQNGRADTSYIQYSYSDSNLLMIIRKKDSHGYTSSHFTYDSLGRVIQEETRRDVLDTIGKVKQSIVLNSETMEYRNFPFQEKKTLFNSYKLPYVEEMNYFNADGYLIEKEERLKMTSGIVRYIYAYNDKGLLESIQKKNNLDGSNQEEWVFKYDKFGNLIEKHVFKNGVFMTNIQIMYNRETFLLSSILRVEVSTNYMTILRFKSYEFFD
jgi:hypothetical protein